MAAPVDIARSNVSASLFSLSSEKTVLTDRIAADTTRKAAVGLTPLEVGGPTGEIDQAIVILTDLDGVSSISPVISSVSPAAVQRSSVPGGGQPFSISGVNFLPYPQKIELIKIKTGDPDTAISTITSGITVASTSISFTVPALDLTGAEASSEVVTIRYYFKITDVIGKASTIPTDASKLTLS